MLELYLAAVLLVTPTVALGANSGKTVYSDTSNKELKEKASRLVKNMRDLVSAYNKQARDLRSEYDKKQGRDSTGADVRLLREQWLRESDDLHNFTMRRYRERHWSDAILLADEILRRLPKQKRQTSILPIYQHPTNVLGVQAVAAHLEAIAKSLPS